MGRRGDNTGVDQTCPLIDRVRDFIEGIEWNDEEKDLEQEANGVCLLLEQVRKMNSDLRDFGNKHYEELCEMEKDRDYYQKKAENLEDDVKILNKEIGQLEKQLS